MAKQILKSQGIHIPVVTTLHGTDITLVGKDASYEPVVTFSINQSDGVTSVSQDLKRETYHDTCSDIVSYCFEQLKGIKADIIIMP